MCQDQFKRNTKQLKIRGLRSRVRLKGVNFMYKGILFCFLVLGINSC